MPEFLRRNQDRAEKESGGSVRENTRAERMVLDIFCGVKADASLRVQARGAMGKMETDDLYGQVCRGENIKSGTGWRVVRVVRLQEAWRHRTLDRMGVGYGGLGRVYILIRSLVGH